MCHLCTPMQPFRDIAAVTHNGYSNGILPNTHSESSFNQSLQKFNNYRGNMAITTDMYVGQHNRQSHGLSQIFRPLQFHHGSHPQNLHNLSSCHITSNGYSPSVRLWDVWSYNFHEGMRLVRRLVRNARYVAVDTEFPGVVAKVFGEYTNSFEQAYHNIKVNIDMLRPIQIGFSFFGERGQSVDIVSTVQFNLKWNVDNETHAADSIQLLEQCGIDFEKLKLNGIELHEFAEAFLASGLALNDQITWIGFHSAYDFAYMMKLCTDWLKMPENFMDFQKLLIIFFPRIVDLKAIMNEHKFLKGGLQELADALHVPRVGLQHQAGSDAMLTGETFFRFLEEHSEGKLEMHVLNLVYGLNYCPNGSSNTFMHMNGSSPIPEMNGHHTNPNLPNSQRNKTHSADHSGRTSPEGSMSGHKSS